MTLFGGMGSIGRKRVKGSLMTIGWVLFDSQDQQIGCKVFPCVVGSGDAV